jgi:hypothetical protein
MQAHLGKTLKLFNISPLEHAEKLNILCDCMASKSQQHGFSDNGCDILPTERWAVYSYHPDPHKVTGPLGKEVTLSLHFHKLATYIYTKHGLKLAKLEKIDTTSLGQVLQNMNIHIHKQITIIKLLEPNIWTFT